MFFFVRLLRIGELAVETAIRYWRETLIVALFSLVLYQNTSPIRFLLWVDTIPYYKEQLIDAKTKLDTCVQGNEKLQQTIERQNEQVLKWKKVSSSLQTKVSKLQKQLDQMRRQTSNTVDAILAEPTPKTCHEAFEYLKAGIDEIKFPVNGDSK